MTHEKQIRSAMSKKNKEQYTYCVFFSKNSGFVVFEKDVWDFIGCFLVLKRIVLKWKYKYFAE